MPRSRYPITTDPAEFDRDGDGLSNGEEAGARQTGPDGDDDDGITDPRNVDTDDDDLLDSEEVFGITSPVNADTDGDGLNDRVELYNGFDPLNRNPDGDFFSDAAEYARGSDPFYYDLTGEEYAAAVVAGFILGDAGQNLVDMGWLNAAHLQCFGYVGGWLASGFLVIGDVRDTLAALVRGDVVDTFLNAIGLIPLLGDGSQVVRVVAKYLEWLPDTRLAIRVWLQKQFAATPDLLRNMVTRLFKQCRNSFSAETLVSTGDGPRPIASIERADLVWAWDAATGRTELFTVTATMSHTDSTQVHLTIDGESIETTPDHPFFTRERGWVAAGDLWNGAHLRQASGGYGAVQTLWFEEEPQVMYNLTVAEAHTFFVGTQQWLVHNNTCNFRQLIDEFEQLYGSPNVHASSRHGPQTTMEDHKRRAITGIRPDDLVQKQPVNSTRFLTESGMYDAMQQARAKYLVERPPSGIVEFDIGYVVAEGYYKGGVIEGTTSTVRAFFDNQGRL
ncbi:MAG: hypothetical protein MI924_13930, partial [Chloroflexales bacterium]|nr:hypothetical protein [Chloroflexales bacterium]